MSTLFLSHAHEDADLAAEIALYISRSLPNVYEIFRSSDVRAIPAGRWLATLTEKLRSAACVIVLVTPASKAKPWLFFETGFAAGTGRDPIPVCGRGVKVEALMEPLSTYQSVQLDIPGGPEQLIAMIRNQNTTVSLDSTSLLEAAHRHKDVPFDLREVLRGLGPLVPYNVIRIRWKGRKNPTYYVMDDIEIGPHIYDWSDTFQRDIMAFGGKLPDPDGDERLGAEIVQEVLKGRFGNSPDDQARFEEFSKDQYRLSQEIAFNLRPTAIGRCPLSIHEAGQPLQVYWPMFFCRRIDEETSGRHEGYYVVVFPQRAPGG
jgi:TIR domain